MTVSYSNPLHKRSRDSALVPRPRVNAACGRVGKLHRQGSLPVVGTALKLATGAVPPVVDALKATICITQGPALVSGALAV
jgi:hypothetical protein